MNDDKIREILNKNNDQLTKPVNEWAEIVKRIDHKKRDILFNWKVFTGFVLSSFLLLAINFYPADKTSNSLEMNDQLIVQDLSDISDYLNTDSESIYAWVE